MQLFSVILNKQTEFTLIGIADLVNSKVKYQGLLNGVPFVQGADYEKVRKNVLHAVKINKQKVNHN